MKHGLITSESPYEGPSGVQAIDVQVAMAALSCVKAATHQHSVCRVYVYCLAHLGLAQTCTAGAAAVRTPLSFATPSVCPLALAQPHLCQGARAAHLNRQGTITP